jgi:hypothetical protein
MYRISRNGQEPIVDVDQVEAIEPAIRSSEPGRYHVDEIRADPLPSRLPLARTRPIGVAHRSGI